MHGLKSQNMYNNKNIQYDNILNACMNGGGGGGGVSIQH